MPETNYLVEALDLSFAYRDERVLRNVSFQVAKGDFVAVIGGNGAGKSTLLRLLLGELQPERGHILLFGTALPAYKDWSSIGYVPQNGTALAEGFPATVREVVSMGTYRRNTFLRPWRAGNTRRRVEEALAQVGMEAFSHKMIHHLSGGQMQRVMIARALAGDNRLLLLDEPTTGVDNDSTLSLYRLLETLVKDRGITVMMVTHDMERATPYTNRVFCLERGSLIELSSQQIEHELTHRHQHP